MGGVTTLKVRVGSRGWPWKARLEPSVQRNVSHIIDDKERATACSPELHEQYLHHESHVSFDTYRLPVVYPTHSTCTNWGRRALTASEMRSPLIYQCGYLDDQLF